jgi:hypothetical protein
MNIHLANKLAYFIFISVVVCSCTDSHQVFQKLSSSHTNIKFENKPLTKKAFGILYYLYYYNGGGVATGDVNNDGLPDIYFTANDIGRNKLYLNKGNFEFEDVTEKAGVQGTSDWCSGVTMADINGDGYLDIYVGAIANHHGLGGHNELFINNKNGTFTESSAQYGLNFSGFTTQTAFFDYDHDGDLDCYILNQSQRPNENIVDTSYRRSFDQYAGDRLYRNDLNTSAHKFTDVTKSAGIYQGSLGYGLGLAVGDMNNDGWDEIYIGNDFHENDYYYINNGDGTFTESGAQHFGHYSRFSMGNDIADFNNDGQLDIITVDMLPPDERVLKTYGSDENSDIYSYKLKSHGFQFQYSKNCLQRNNGDGRTFSDISLISGISATDWSWSPLFADFDNDGKKDLFVSSGIVKRPVDLDYIRFASDLYNQRALNSTDKYDDQALEKMPDGASHPFLFKGDGDMFFKDVSEDWGTSDISGYFTGASYADLDNDGILDLVVNSVNAPSFILKNNSLKKNFITISLKGKGQNTQGVGSKIYVFSNGKLQYQQLMNTRGFQSSSDLRVHFGLDSVAAIDSILVVWPDQRYQLLKNVKCNQILNVEQNNSSGVFKTADFIKPVNEILSRDLTEKRISWKHDENKFNDFNFQYLIPHEESTRGPKIAVADVNGDGMEDFFVCGAKDQPGALMLQQRNGSFISADTALFATDKICEDVDAGFFDANGDGKPDLYVVSGGNEYSGNAPPLLDRLYINNGNGKFTKSENALPAIFSNKSCFADADIDKDGDLDIFVGTLADAKAYGIPQTSSLLINDGKGNFSLAGENIIPLKSIGMISSASFADMNKDGWPDLVAAGEWMPLTVFINKNGKFEKTEMPSSTGLWQTVFIDDVNKDGNPDILAGNWGWNTKYWSGKNGPIRLYVADFDHNGRTDQLLSYTYEGKEYPFLAKDEVERSLPTLKKHYLKYAEYAGVVMKDVFYGWVDSVKPITAERLGSVVCFGDGKGQFKMKDLPAQLQLSPIFSFSKMDSTGDMYVSGGNFFDVIPYEGQYDAQALAVFTVKGDSITPIPPSEYDPVKGQVRDVKLFDQNRLIIARNNDSLLVMKVIGTLPK